MKTYAKILGFALVVWLASPIEAGGVQPGTADEGLVQLTGKLYIIWGDPVGESTLRPHHSFWLTDNAGKTWELTIEENVLQAVGGMLALSDATVVVQGRTISARWPTLDVTTITREKEAASDSKAADILGSQPYVWLLFRFADNPSTPATHEWFEEQALGEWGMDPFWREVSYNNINLIGSEVRGWFQLPGTPIDYGIMGDPENDVVNLDALLYDALQASNPYVNFSLYTGMNLIFNGPLDCCAWGGRPLLTLDGVTKRWGVTWLGDGGFQGHDVVTHEMGHSFGLPHSAGCGVKYESQWDVMSGGCGTCTHVDPRTGFPHGTHPNAYHKNRLGWIHPLHHYMLPLDDPTAARLTLFDLARVPPPGQLLMASALVRFPLRFYTVERRRWTGYDVNLPGEAVVIHIVDEALDIPADLINVGGSDCNDEGSMWRPGESFYDSLQDVLIGIEWADEDSSVVTLTNEPRNVVYVDRAGATCEDGSSLCPWDTVSEGHAAVMPYGQVYVAPGYYPETLVMGKPAVLAPWGSGSVVIGQ